MQRPNQPAQTECCSTGGEEGSSTVGGLLQTTGEKRTQGTSRAATGSSTPVKQFSLDTDHAGGEGFRTSVPNTKGTVQGEVPEGLPGSKSVASEERVCGNLGDPAISRRSNCENPPGQPWQRQEARLRNGAGVRSACSSPEQSREIGTDSSEGADTNTQPAKETGPARRAGKDWRTSLRAIAMKAVQEKEHRFGGLYQLLNEANLRECFDQLRKEAAPGVDGVTYEAYAENLEANIRDLVQRLKNKSYRARWVRRQYIPKENGKLRPLGIPALEDKLLQCAVAQILIAIYEADFLPCSLGYRPGLGPHDAVEALTNELLRGRYDFVVEADIKGFFDNIRHEKLLEMLEKRIGDGAMLRLINKWLKAGILETTGEVIHPQSGTPQGGIVSPVLANVYLHYALDVWFEEVVRKGNLGPSKLIRYADDFVACFGYRHEALVFQRALAERLKEYGLELAADKTQMLRFGRNGGRHNGRFDFLGFEFSWDLSRKGQPFVKRRTARKKMKSSLARFTAWIKSQRSGKVRETMTTLRKKLTGYGNYYGVIGNSKSLSQFFYRSSRILFTWLNRRSQKRSYSWKAFNRMLKHFDIRAPKRTQKPEPSCRQREMNLCDLVFRLASAWRV